jgi:hemoglobin
LTGTGKPDNDPRVHCFNRAFADSGRRSMRRYLLGVALVLLATTTMFAGQAPAKKSLYDRIGGEAALTKVVDEFVARAAANPKVNFTRKGKFVTSDAAVKTLKTHLVNFLGSAFGGPQKYTGRSMKEAHKGMGITQAEFDALAADLRTVLQANKVPKAETEEIMKIAASTAPDIVEKK